MDQVLILVGAEVFESVDTQLSESTSDNHPHDPLAAPGSSVELWMWRRSAAFRMESGLVGPAYEGAWL
jgi:hypothetical protein